MAMTMTMTMMATNPSFEARVDPYDHQQQLITTGHDQLPKKRKINNTLEVVADQQIGKRIRTVINNNNDETLKMVCGSYYIPKEVEGKPDYEGEDAHFVFEEVQTIGVADGVGGWARKGIDAGEYARQLMSNAEEQAGIDYMLFKGGAVNPMQVLEKAYEGNFGIQGSSTACILSLDRNDGVLHAANVGDSGFMVFRDSKMVYKSPTQQRRFNCPYQLGNHSSGNRPEEAEEIKVKMIPGDVIVVGTDGLLDNLCWDELEDLVLENSNKEGGDGEVLDCKLLACLIADQACNNSMSEDYISPFSMEALHNGLDHIGGKVDDITVIVAHVVPS